MNRVAEFFIVRSGGTILLGCADIDGGSDSVDRGEIVFADLGWDSVRFHNAVAGLIAEEIFGYSWTVISGSSPVIHGGVQMGEMNG